MILIFALIVFVGLMAIALLKYGDTGYDTRHDMAGFVGIIMGIIAVIAAFDYACLGFYWISADHKAQIINREYGTHYTQEEVLYASDVIDTIRQIQRNRIELNGNLINENSNQNAKQGE